MIVLYWYLIVGIMLGCVITYVLVDKLGFEYLFEDYKYSSKDDEFKLDLSFNTFKTIVTLLIPLVVAFTWPYFMYLTARKYFK